MFEICAFANIRRPATRTAWTTPFTKKIGSGSTYTVVEMFAGVRADGSETFAVRVTDVTGAGGVVASYVEFTDRFDALMDYNARTGAIVAVEEIVEA